MKKYLILIALCINLLNNAFAQDNKIEVVNFYHEVHDGTANRLGGIVYDQNGEKCALIKVMTNDPKYSFDAGTLGIVKSIHKTGEIWLYVPYGVKKLTIRHTNLETLTYTLPEPTKSSKTYIMTLKSKDAFDNTVEDYSKSGKFNLEVFPPNAKVELNAVTVNLDSTGKGSFPLYYGRYTYSISADNYYTYNGRVQINANSESPTMKIRLKQAFGWLNIICKEGLEDAAIYIDGVKQDIVSKSAIPVASGKRTIRIVNPLYFPHEEKITISDSTGSQIYVALKPNYGTVKFRSDNISHIYSDNTYLGQGEWSGRLPVGKHIIECRAESHTSSFREITVEKNSNEQYLLNTPTPIYGFAEISSQPEGAEVYIDGILQGNTPFMKGNILIGARNITLKAPGYTPEKAKLTIFSDSIVRASYTLSNRIPVTIESYPSESTLYIDGDEIGLTPFKDTLVAGEHQIKLVSSKKFRPIDKKIYIDNDNSSLMFEFEENLVRDNELYAEGVFNTGNSIGYGGALGGYIHKFNIEGGISFGSKSDPIYWNKTGDDNPQADISTYKPTYYWGKIGYAIPLTSKIRLTPQMGTMIVSLAESFTGASHCDKANAMSALISCKANYAISTFMGISITPEYRYNISKSKGYETLSDVSSQIDGYAKDFSLKLGIYFFF